MLVGGTPERSQLFSNKADQRDENYPMKKIAIIDDEPDICEGISELLKDAGYETAVAYRGKEGLDLVIEQKPDLVILDIALPDLDGTIVYEKIRKHPDPAVNEVKVIFLTAL